MKVDKLFLIIKRYICSPDYRFILNAFLGIYNTMPDEEYLKRKFAAKMGMSLNLKNPKTFNEKLQWLKLYDRKSQYVVMADKYKVRDYISEKIGNQYLIPLLGVWDKAEDIDFESLPNQFVLKCNHNSGVGMCICKDKKNIDESKIKTKLKKALKEDYFLENREWPYKDIPRKIIGEKFMVDAQSRELPDYKIHCFNGKPKFTLVCRERFSSTGLKEDFMDLNWKRIEMQRPNCPHGDSYPQKPINYNLMLQLAERLSQNIPFLRVDFYEINGRVYFGELTFFPAGGMGKFEPLEWDYKLGEELIL